MPPSPPTPTRVCPECGTNPRVGRPPAPWWCSRTGLPLWAALALVATMGVMTAWKPITYGRPPKAVGARMTFVMGSTSVQTPPIQGITVADVRSAAAGVAASAERVGTAVGRQVAALDQSMEYTTLVRVAEGPGIKTRRWGFGWPAQWLYASFVSEYGDLIRLTPPDPSNSVGRSYLGPNGIHWWWRSAIIDVRTTLASGNSAGAGVRWSALGYVGALVAAVWLLVRRLLRRVRQRAIRTAGFGMLLIGSLLMLAWPGTQSTMIPANALKGGAVPGPPAQERITGAQATQLTESERGRVKLANLLLPQLAAANPLAAVDVIWMKEHAPSDSTHFGWPAVWLSFLNEYPVQQSDGHHGRAGQRMCWESGPQWTRTDATGSQRRIGLNVDGFAADLFPVGLAYGLPVAAWGLLRGRRLRRWEREGRCFTCGYELGWRPEEPEVAEAAGGSDTKPTP